MIFVGALGLGIAIGLRYSLPALLPAILGIICVHVAADGRALDRVASTVICTACIQGGYIIGLTSRDFARQLLARFTTTVRNI